MSSHSNSSSDAGHKESGNSLPENKPVDASSDDEETGIDYTERILKGSAFIFSGSMVGKIVGFALQLVLTRGLGKALYGLYTIGFTVLRLAESVSTLGLQNGIVRFAAPNHERGDTSRVKGTFLAGGALGLAAAVGVGALLFAASPWLASRVFNDPNVEPQLVERTISVFAFGLPFYVFTYLASRMARALGKMQVDTLLDSVLQPALFLLLVGGVFSAGWGFTLTLYAFLASTVLAAGASVYAIYRLFPPLLSRHRPAFDLRRLLRFSLPIVGVALSSIGMTYTDRLMLGALSTSESVGLYQAAANLGVQLRFVLFALTATFSPIISELYHNGRHDALAELYADTVRWILVTTLPVAILFVVFAPEIMAIWGPGFRAGAPLLRILTAAYLIVAAAGSVGQMLQMSDHQDFVFGVNVTMALFNLILNWLLIRWYGVLGAAVATGLVQGLGNIVEVAALRYFTSIQPFRWTLWKPLLAGGLTGTGAWMLASFLPAPAHWLIGIPAVLLVYAGLLFGLNLHPKDRSIVEALWTRLRASF